MTEKEFEQLRTKLFRDYVEAEKLDGGKPGQQERSAERAKKYKADLINLTAKYDISRKAKRDCGC